MRPPQYTSSSVPPYPPPTLFSSSRNSSTSLYKACTILPLSWDRHLIPTFSYPFPSFHRSDRSTYIINIILQYHHDACSTTTRLCCCFRNSVRSQHSTQQESGFMVDRDAQEDKQNQEAAQQCPTALSMPDRDSLIPFSNMDSLLAPSSKGTRLRTCP